MPGDSGSWILDNEGDLVGLLFAGTGAEYKSRSLVMPIETIIQDIEDQTGYTVRLPGGVAPSALDDGSQGLPKAYQIRPW